LDHLEGETKLDADECELLVFKEVITCPSDVYMA